MALSSGHNVRPPSSPCSFALSLPLLILPFPNTCFVSTRFVHLCICTYCDHLGNMAVVLLGIQAMN
jgi:hypothetical protein